MRRYWTRADEEQLREGWGKARGGITVLARKMGRTVDALKCRASRMKLGPWLDAGEEVSLNQMVVTVTGLKESHHTYTIMRWQRMGLPIRRKKVQNSWWRVVRIEDFWAWAREHRSKLDFSRFEENAMGMEPEWAKIKRAVDRENRRHQQPRKCRWTMEEVAILRQMTENGATYADLKRMLRRTSPAIRRKIYDLGLPKPARVKGGRWTEAEQAKLVGMVKQGCNYDVCALALQRSPDAVRSRIGQLKCRGELDQCER